MSSYKYVGIKIDGESDRTVTLVACLGFLMFGVMRMGTRWVVQKLGFLKVFILLLTTNVLH